MNPGRASAGKPTHALMAAFRVASTSAMAEGSGSVVGMLCAATHSPKNLKINKSSYKFCNDRFAYCFQGFQKSQPRTGHTRRTETRASAPVSSPRRGRLVADERSPPVQRPRHAGRRRQPARPRHGGRPVASHERAAHHNNHAIRSLGVSMIRVLSAQ